MRCNSSPLSTHGWHSLIVSDPGVAEPEHALRKRSDPVWGAPSIRLQAGVQDGCHLIWCKRSSPVTRTMMINVFPARGMRMREAIDEQGSGSNDRRARHMGWHAHSTPDPDGPKPGNEPVPEEVPQPDPVREPDPIPHQVPIRTVRQSC